MLLDLGAGLRLVPNQLMLAGALAISSSRARTSFEKVDDVLQEQIGCRVHRDVLLARHHR